MARFDIHAYPSGTGLLLDVQADLLDHLTTRVVVPLLPLAQAPKPAKRLNPVFQVDGEPYVMATQFLAAVPIGELGPKRSSVADQFAEVTTALDMVFQGF